MAIQRSIDGGSRQGRIHSQEIRSEEVTRGAAAVRLLARFAAMAALFGRAAQASFERIRSAQAHGTNRKQMKLVESLPLGNRRQLLLVVCENQRYLVGAGADSVGSILAIDALPVSRDRAARGPELVRRKGRDAVHDARSRPAEEPGFNLWH
jgi:flagellar biogenesis protein FliO